MKILAINSGSSSIKFQLSNIERTSLYRISATVIASGKISSIGKDSRFEAVTGKNHTVSQSIEVTNHDQAFEFFIHWIKEENLTIDAVGHRIVHGGDTFSSPVRVNQNTIKEIDALRSLAPLHNPIGLAGIQAFQKELGKKCPMVAVFDTAFHTTIPDYASEYAIPRELCSRYKIKRYGFHGIAHSYLADRYFEITGSTVQNTKLVTLQMGHGTSASAIRDGRSIDTSMGFTPLEGLVMATRSGSVDPSIVAYLSQKEKVEASTVVDWLNQKSGLRGISGKNISMKDLLKVEAQEDRARLAIEIYCYQIRKCIGSYLAALSGAHALIFGGGVGENAPVIRQRICKDMEWCGIKIDPLKNERTIGKEAMIGDENFQCRVFAIPVDEESVIAKETYTCIHSID